MQKLVFILFLMSNLSIGILSAQEYKDFVIDENGKKIFCEIVNLKNGKLKYTQRNKSYATFRAILKLKSIHFNDSVKYNRFYKDKFVKPKEGFAHIYFYNEPENIPYTVFDDKEKVAKVKGLKPSLLIVKANKNYNFSCKGNRKEIFNLTPKSGYSYFIKSYISGGWDMQIGNTNLMSIELSLKLDDNEIARYSVISYSDKIFN